MYLLERNILSCHKWLEGIEEYNVFLLHFKFYLTDHPQLSRQLQQKRYIQGGFLAMIGITWSF